MNHHPPNILPPVKKGIEQRLLIYQIEGCVLLVALSWLDELLDLPTVLFGRAPGYNWREAALETAVILAVAVPLFLFNRRLIRGLVFLENFLGVCAWCKKIGVEDEWVTMEKYFHRGLKTIASHGMCPECFAKLEHELGQQKAGQK